MREEEKIEVKERRGKIVKIEEATEQQRDEKLNKLNSALMYCTVIMSCTSIIFNSMAINTRHKIDDIKKQLTQEDINNLEQELGIVHNEKTENSHKVVLNEENIKRIENAIENGTAVVLDSGFNDSNLEEEMERARKNYEYEQYQELKAPYEEVYNRTFEYYSNGGTEEFNPEWAMSNEYSLAYNTAKESGIKVFESTDNNIHRGAR